MKQATNVLKEVLMMLLAERKAHTIKKGKIGVLFNQPITAGLRNWRFNG
jgi:hypothetical protein